MLEILQILLYEIYKLKCHKSWKRIMENVVGKQLELSMKDNEPQTVACL